MDPKEQLVRDFYAARARRDWRAVRGMLADDVVWQEAGDEDFSGTHRGAGDVTALLEKLVEITGGTFSLEPVKFVVTAEHVATNARWHAERGVKRAEGND